MSKIDRQLAEVFDVEIVKEPDVIRDGEVIPPDTDKEDNDFDKARVNLHNLLEQGNLALQFAMDVARENEQARSLEVYTNLLNTLVEANMKLMDVHEKRRKIKNMSVSKEIKKEESHIQNNLFVGTTTELKKFIKEMRKDNEQQSTNS
jgi:hypothetical protein